MDAIVSSHSHGDHADGLEQALATAGQVDVFVHPAAFETVYWKNGDRVGPLTLPLSRAQLASRVRRLIETKGPTVVAEGIMVTGGIPRVTDFEDTATASSRSCCRTVPA